MLQTCIWPSIKLILAAPSDGGSKAAVTSTQGYQQANIYHCIRQLIDLHSGIVLPTAFSSRFCFNVLQQLYGSRAIVSGKACLLSTDHMQTTTKQYAGCLQVPK
jgi:hypothetical protein